MLFLFDFVEDHLSPSTIMESKTVNGRAEIDTRPPFRSVKEAVSLFGEGLVGADVHIRKPKQTMPAGGSVESMTMELEETKQSLEKAKEETELMATEVSSLKQELDYTRRELQQLKQLRGLHWDPSNMMDEHLKFVQDSPKPRDDDEDEDEDDDDDDDHKHEVEFQKKRYVTFAHPTLSQIILPEGNPSPVLLERSSSVKKKKKKSFGALFPLFGGIFPKRKVKCDTDLKY